jgi:hypothetical protein
LPRVKERLIWQKKDSIIFVKKENQIKGYKAILDFADEHLKGAPSSL